MDIHFNSKVRGRDEPDCAYGPEHDQAHHHRTKDDTKSGSSREKTSRLQTLENKPKTTENKPQPMANKRGIISIVLTVIAALAVFLAPQISNIVEGVMDVLSSDEGVTVGGTSDNAQVSEQAEMINYETLAETDILGITTPCTAYAHMEISGEDIAFMCQAFLETHYPDNVPEIKKDFNGYKINDGSGEIMYENEYSARLNNGVSEYIAVGADAVTGSAHYINIQMADKELIREFLEVFLTNLSGISGVTADDLNLLFETDDFGFSSGSCGNYGINVYYRSSEAMYSVSMQYNAYPWKSCVLLEEQEISSRQVVSDGVECTAAPHFETELKGASAVELIHHWLDANNYHGLTMETYPENRRAVYEQLADLRYEVLDYNCRYTWSSGDTPYTINLNTDTFSDRIHSVEFDNFSKDDIPQLMTLATQILGFGNAEDFTDQCLYGYEADGFCFLRADGYEIYVSGYDDNLYMDITPLRQ